MTQPLDQRAQCKAMGDVDESLGEFWMENPWEPTANNLSAFERNRVLLSVPAETPDADDGNPGAAVKLRRRLRDVSTQSGADLDSDSRGVVSGDFNGDGRPDLIVRSSGGGPVRIFENRWPGESGPDKSASGNWLIVSLRGSRSNSQGLGARIRIDTGKRTIHRTMQRVSSFMSQQSASLLIGVGDASEVDRLTVDWPLGETQVLTGIPTGQHILVREGADGFDVQ